ncbi:MAG: hypothetical protein QF535_07060, partial [Anaerolineales bacterium]|nr:hypothetical protein [Anaerolineales bacterium]
PKPSPSPSPSPSPKPSPTPKPPVKPDNTVFYLLIAGILVGVAGYFYWKRTSSISINVNTNVNTGDQEP